MAKSNGKKFGEFDCRFDRWIDTIDWVFTDGSMAIGQIRFLCLIVDTTDQKEKIFNQWIDNIDENGTKSIDHYYRYRSIDPSPIVPSYGWESWQWLVLGLVESINSVDRVESACNDVLKVLAVMWYFEKLQFLWQVKIPVFMLKLLTRWKS
jgi:hypothetical protein